MNEKGPRGGHRGGPDERTNMRVILPDVEHGYKRVTWREALRFCGEVVLLATWLLGMFLGAALLQALVEGR